MQRWLIVGAATCLALTSVHPGYATGMKDEPSKGYTNPIIRGMNPDPSVVRVGSDYYLTTSTFEYFPGCPIYHSRDLIHWQRIGYALSRPSQYPSAKSGNHPSTFAATLRYNKGVFYLITTDVKNGIGNFYVTAANPAGPWSDPILVEKGMFDPSLFFDDDGKVYYTRRGPRAGENIVQAEIDIKTGKLLTPLRTIATGFVAQDDEGPHLYKINNWYYLTVAEGGSRFLHMESVGRSHNPWGPFEPSPSNPFISQHTVWNAHERSTGHSDLVSTPDGKWWAVYLATRHANYSHFSLGRETFLAPVEWVDGWPHVKPENLLHLEVHSETLPQHSWPDEPTRDDFNQKTLGLEWNLLGPPLVETYSLTERPGFLRLKGQADGLTFSSTTAFVGRRQTEWKTISQTSLEFLPSAENEEAGLTIYMDPKYHYEIFKTRRAGQNVIVLRKSVGDMKEESQSIPLGSGGLQLKIESDAEQYRFYYSEHDGEWKLLGSGMERLIASEVANVWTGAYLGMYSTGNGQKCTSPADFDWFDYQAIPEATK
jgi:xylan 1,4-beta-xylosidase